MSAAAAQYHPLTTVRLTGQLRQFGRSFRLAVRTPREAVRALCVQVPGFERFLLNANARGLEFAVFRDKRNLSEQEIDYQGDGAITLAPVIAGSKRAGALQTIIGVALIVVASVATGGAGMAFSAGGLTGAAANMGLAFAVGGVVQMLSPQAKGLTLSAGPENTPGYAFGSARNTTASGNPVPLCIGKRRWGGAVISAAIYAEDRM
ncbi:tail assembly protein [Pseudomonas sp. R32]|uniref:tail assembly protein n=1 Tax=Pseudomonas sp. R32 TaxID=1573704 RepID=UPI00132F3CE3|nr:tail assembly protein [Pseudomonas sp. R32]QHF27390.1 phage tail protein [Pseudomonas sp. R32]